MTPAATLRRSLEARRAVVVPGCHDALSAMVIERAGFEAIQVSGFGLSGSLLGAPDIGLLSMSDNLEATSRIVAAVSIPVMADADTGGGGSHNAADITRRLIEMGAAGMNIEDQTFPKRCGHLEGKSVIPAEEMVTKVRACVRVRDDLAPDFVINARTDAVSTHGIETAITRCRSYLEAGADMVFIDAIPGFDEITRALDEIDGLLSVNLMDAVTGVRTDPIPIAELRRVGVARVSIPVASILVAHRAMERFFAGLHAADGQGDPELVTPFDDYLEIVGLPHYLDAAGYRA